MRNLLLISGIIFASIVVMKFLMKDTVITIKNDQESKQNFDNIISPLVSVSPVPTSKLRVWNSNWSNGNERYLESGERDSFDFELIARGNGTVHIDGNGVALLSGDSPRIYVYDQKKNRKWGNVEIIVYSRRISETRIVSSQGIVIGARSEHQDASSDNPCAGRTYYGRLLYDGRAVFQKELVHELAYSVNKPSENNKANWDAQNGSFPKNVWIGVKFIVKNLPDSKVSLELFRDLTDGKNGGGWEKVAEYIDGGSWSEINGDVDVKRICGFSPNIILSKPGTSIFIRNDYVSSVQYKNFSIREID